MGAAAVDAALGLGLEDENVIVQRVEATDA